MGDRNEIKQPVIVTKIFFVSYNENKEKIFLQLWAPKCVCGRVIFVKLGAHMAPKLFTVICNPEGAT